MEVHNSTPVVLRHTSVQEATGGEWRGCTIPGSAVVLRQYDKRSVQAASGGGGVWT